MFSLVVAGGSVTMYLCDKWIAREKESEILQERENRNFLKKQMHELAAYANRLSQGKFNVLSMSPDEMCKFCHDMIIRKKKELESRIKELEREINDMRPVIAVCREKVDKDTVERLKSILKKGGDINEVDDEYRSPLHWACENDSIELVKILVEAGADVNAREKNGDIPLITAVRKGRTKICDYLIKHSRVDLNFALYVAAVEGNPEMCKYLISTGGNVNVAHYSYLSWTPLHVAANNGHASVIDVLIQNGADTETRDSNGDTPLCLAAQNGHTKVCERLIQNGAKIDAQNRKNGRTALHVAAVHGNNDVYRILVKANANAHIKDKEGNTPEDLARTVQAKNSASGILPPSDTLN